MIYQIQRKEYDKLKRDRKVHYHGQTKGQALLFKAANGFYYKQTDCSMAGVKEMNEFIKNVAEGVKEQTSLL